MKHSLLFFFLFGFFFSAAQNPLVKQWDKRFGGNGLEEISVLQQTTDGGYILGGVSQSGISGDKTQDNWNPATVDYWVVKTDSLGIKQWDKRFGGTETEYLYSLQQTADGGYILGGVSNSGISGDKTQPFWGGGNDYWIVKIDSVGNKLWDKRFGGVLSNNLTAVRQTKDGGYILGGYTNSGIGGDKTQPSWDPIFMSTDYWVVKVNSLGIKQWDKRFGGRNDDRLFSLEQTTDGGYILGGYSNSQIDGDKSQNCWLSTDYWIVKIDSLGNELWDKDFGGTDVDLLYSIKQTTDGGYILGGVSSSPVSGDKTQDTWGGDSDFWILKTDSLGIKLWDKRFGGWDVEDAFGNICQTSDGGYLFEGASYSAIGGDKTENNLGNEQTWVVKTDALGNKQWDKTIFTKGHDENGYAIQTKDGCYTTANCTDADTGAYKTQAPRGLWDFWIVKFCDTTFRAIVSAGNAACGNSCNGSATVLPLYGTPPYQYHWQPGNDSTATVSNLCADTYTVTVTDADSSMATYTIVITSTSIPTVNIYSADSLICASDTTQICAPSGFSNYLWNTGATANCIATSLAGNYYVTVTGNNGCTAESNHIAVTVHPLPPVSISVNGDTLTAYNAANYQWYLNGNAITGATNNIYIANQGGSYSVAVTDTNGCSATSNAIVITGVDETRNPQSAIRISPNPFTNEINITANTNGANIILTDVTGRKVMAVQLPTTNCLLPTANLATGVYFLQIIINGERIVKQMVKQ